MFESNKPIHISNEQEHAITLCCDLTEKIVGVTGGAGVGKTMVLGHVYNELKKRRSVVLAAPTGRAAKRITEMSGIPAKTVHRLLEFPMPDDPIGAEPAPPNIPRRNKHNMLEEQVIIIDEASMLSTELYGYLLDAMRPGAVIRMFGDNQQLAPVEDNSGLPPPFIDVLKMFPSVTLTYNFRSGDEIVANSQLILRGQLPRKGNRFTVFYTDYPMKALQEFVTPEFAGLEHQIILPMRATKNGTIQTNPGLQLKFNARGPLLRLQRYGDKDAPLAVRANDKYLWIKNDYALAVFNGEIGHIDWIDEESGELGLIAGRRKFTVPSMMKSYNPHKRAWIRYDPRKQIELGYAITTHKSQGSEFDTVVYCICAGHYHLLSRRNMYTAVTRAKNRVVIITDRKAMSISLSKRD